MAAGAGLFGTVQAQLDLLSPRDRKLLAGLLGFVGVAFVLFVALTLRSALANKASRIVAQKEALEAMQDLRDEYVEADAKIDAAEKRVAELGGKEMSAYLEEVARKGQIADELSVNRLQTDAEGGIEQTQYKVELRRVSFDAALLFLWDVETSGYPLRIDSADFRVTKSGEEKVYRLVLELTTFALPTGAP
jgi:type II secretory pathway component PulM